MSYQGVVNIIRGVAQAVSPTGFFEHGRTWDASLNFDEGDPQIYLYPLQNTVDESNNYFETWSIVMGFFFQDAPDSTPAEREDIIANADDLLRSFIATISQVEGIAISGVRAEPKYRQMAGTYSGMLLNFTLGATTNVCDEEAPPDIPNVPTFCEKVETCLGISETGSTTEYLNRRGEWATPAGGGGATVIEKTKSQFLALAAASGLQVGAVYKITDIDPFTAVYINALSASAFEYVAQGFAWVPVYIEDGDYKGQYHAELGAVANGEIYTWGEWNYKNESGGALTPDVPSPNVFDTANRFTQLPKNATNFYELVAFNLNIDNEINVALAENVNTNSADLRAVELILGLNNAVLASTNNPAQLKIYTINKGFQVYNNRVERLDNNNRGIQNNECPVFDNYLTGDDASDTGIIQNKSIPISNCVGNIRIQANTNATGEAYIKNVTCVNGGYIDILSSDFHDACSIEDFNVTSDGEVYFWDVHMNEECRLERWTFNNTSGNDVYIQDCFLNSSVVLEDWTFSGGEVINIHNLHSITIRNLDSISLNNFEWTNSQNTSYTLDLSGFTKNITDFWVDGNEGGFTIQHNFQTSNLASGSSLLLNLIPIGARLTSIVASGSLTGANIELGIEADDESLVSVPVSLLPLEWSGVSKAAAANRSLKISANGGNITAGLLTVKVSFIL